MLFDLDSEYLYLTKNVSIVYHHYGLNDENVVDDLKVMDDEQQDDLDRMDVEVAVVGEVVVENVLLLVVEVLEGDDEDVQDDEMKQMALIVMTIEAK